MINLRYHVVSITAVFLALALGLTLGSTFLERATVDSLNSQLGNLENDLDASGQRISDLEGSLAVEQERFDVFVEQGVGPLLDGELIDVPVMVVVPRGTDEAIVDRSVSTLVNSGADITGTWFVTDRFALDDEAERRDLANVLGMESDLEGALRRTASQRLANVFLDRMAPVGPVGEADTSTTTTAAPEPGTDGTVPTGDTPPADDTVSVDAIGEPDPELLGQLVTAGFLEFSPLGDGDVATTLPPTNGRLVIIADPGASLTPEQFVLPLVSDLTAAGPVSVVLAEGLPDGADPATRGEVVDLVRNDPALTGKLTTVDDLDVFEGWVALALAVEVISDGRISHYGLADSASRLLPASDGPT